MLRQAEIADVDVSGKKVSSASLRTVLRAIYDHAGPVCFASAETISKETGLSERTVRRAIAGLKSLSLIDVEVAIGKSPKITINWRAFNTYDPAVTITKPASIEDVKVQLTPELSSDVSILNPGTQDHEPRNPVPHTPELRSGDPGTQFRRNRIKPKETGLKPEDSFLGGPKPGARRWGFNRVAQLNGGGRDCR